MIAFFTDKTSTTKNITDYVMRYSGAKVSLFDATKTSSDVGKVSITEEYIVKQAEYVKLYSNKL